MRLKWKRDWCSWRFGGEWSNVSNVEWVWMFEESCSGVRRKCRMLKCVNVECWKSLNVSWLWSASKVSNFKVCECIEFWMCVELKLRRYIYTQKIVYALAFEKGIPGTAWSAPNCFWEFWPLPFPGILSNGSLINYKYSARI